RWTCRCCRRWGPCTALSCQHQARVRHWRRTAAARYAGVPCKPASRPARSAPDSADRPASFRRGWWKRSCCDRAGSPDRAWVVLQGNEKGPGGMPRPSKFLEPPLVVRENRALGLAGSADVFVLGGRPLERVLEVIDAAGEAALVQDGRLDVHRQID